jgi:hypothetical protein
MSTELRLAAIITLLSSAALRGATAGKVEALREHLEAAALGADALDPHLRKALEDAFAHWLSVDCHAQSMAVEHFPLAPSARRLH